MELDSAEVPLSCESDVASIIPCESATGLLPQDLPFEGSFPSGDGCTSDGASSAKRRSGVIVCSMVGVSLAALCFTVGCTQWQRGSVLLRHLTAQADTRLEPVWFNTSCYDPGHWPQYAFDGRIDTKWQCAQSTGWLSATLAPGLRAILSRVEFHMAEESLSSGWPNLVTVFGSSDEVEWTRLWTSPLQWNGSRATSICSSHDLFNCDLWIFNAFKFNLSNAQPTWMQEQEPKQLSVHELALFGTQPTRLESKLCADDLHNCMKSQCCRRPGRLCYAKNRTWASCLETCEANETIGHISDPHGTGGPIWYPNGTRGPISDPWTCAPVGVRSWGRKAETALCASASEDCRSTGACCELSHTCYEKDEHAAYCRMSCDTDAGWTCKVLGGQLAMQKQLGFQNASALQFTIK